MHLIKMTEFRSRETIAVLKCLLERAQRGELDGGVALCAKATTGVEEILFTGEYRKDPAKAANAAMRLCVRLAQEQDDIDATRVLLPS